MGRHGAALPSWQQPQHPAAGSASRSLVRALSLSQCVHGGTEKPQSLTSCSRERAGTPLRSNSHSLPTCTSPGVSPLEWRGALLESSEEAVDVGGFKSETSSLSFLCPAFGSLALLPKGATLVQTLLFAGKQLVHYTAQPLFLVDSSAVDMGSGDLPIFFELGEGPYFTDGDEYSEDPTISLLSGTEQSKPKDPAIS